MDLLELLRKGGMDGDVDFLREALRVLVEGIMDAEVSVLVKLYDRKEYADAFLDGVMFANTVGHFRKLESEEIRSDEDEGVATFPLTVSTRLTLTPSGEKPILSPLTLTASDLAGPVTLRPQWFDTLNIFCMVLADSYRDAGELYFVIPESVHRLGSSAVAILDAKEFLRRVKKAVEERNYRLSYKRVEYYDPAIGIRTDPMTLEPLFTKRDSYQAEREFRFVIDRQISSPTPMWLDIGPIHDIAGYSEVAPRTFTDE